MDDRDEDRKDRGRGSNVFRDGYVRGDHRPTTAIAGSVMLPDKRAEAFDASTRSMREYGGRDSRVRMRNRAESGDPFF